MNHSIKNMLIGIFVLSAFGILIFMLLYIHPTVGDNAKTLRVQFTDIDKVNKGTRVTYAGRPVGEVVNIEEIPEARINRTNQKGDVYVYELLLKVDSSVDVYNTDEISLRTSGLLGERNIEINPTPLKEGQKLKIVENEVLFSESTASVEDTMKKLGVVAEKLQLVLDDTHSIFEKYKKEEITEKVSHALQNIIDISDALNQPKIWRETVLNIHTLSEKVNASWDKVDNCLKDVSDITHVAKTDWSSSIHRSLSEIESATTKTNAILTLAAQGKGSVGRLFMNEELYLRFKSMVHKGSTIMDDIGHYGLLFHLDKKWQRLQGRRLKLLEKLSCPDEFAWYFNQEMEEISNSIYHVTQLLNQSDRCPEPLLFNTDFTTRFSDLLKQVGNMEETLELYNEQIITQD